MKTKKILKESYEYFVNSKQAYLLTYEIVKKLYEVHENQIYRAKSTYRLTDNDLLWNLDSISENYPEKKEWYDQVFRELSVDANEALKIIKSKASSFFYNSKSLSEYVISSYLSDDLFPILLYVSATGESGDEIGLLVYRDGKISMFEGNEESSVETDELVRKIMGEADKSVIVYGFHGTDVVEKIRKTKILPSNLYVSPSKEYAKSYWSVENDRTFFSCEVNLSDIKQESDVDWKTIKETPIKQLRVY